MILVTGGTGLVGSHLLYDLLKTGNRVRALKRASSDVLSVAKTISYYSDHAQDLLNQIEWVDGDILDMASLEDALEGIKQVYHCAAIVSFNPLHKEEMLMINVEGTANLVNACLVKGVEKLCHVSSIASLGRNSTASLVTEETHWKTSPQNSWYAISKYGAEREVWRGAEEGLQVVVVNPSVIIGPGNWDKGSIAMIRMAAKGLLYYSGGRTGYVDVRDVTRAMKQLMESKIKGERYIVNGANLTYRAFFDRLHKQFGKPDSKIPIGKVMGELGWRIEKLRSAFRRKEPVITKETARAANYSYEFSSDKIQQALDFHFTPIDSTIKEVCEMYKKEGL